MSIYHPRIADKLLQSALESSGAVLIEGPKWCGKTRTGAEAAGSILFMQDPDSRAANLQAAHIKPSLLLEGTTPRLIDEWQVAPILWDAVRHEVDRRGETGQFILTGSATPVQGDQILHTGTGRISRLRMRPMTLYESNESNGTVRISDLFNSERDISARSSLGIEAIAEVIIRGGWPASVVAKSGSDEKRARDYVDSIVQFDVMQTEAITRNPDRMFALLRSYARNLSTEASLATVLKDMEGGEKERISRPTLQSYLNVLQRLFVIEDLEAWNPSIRSATPLRVTPKRHFVDPSIATAALGLNQRRLLSDFNTFGYLFESLCVRDLRIYAEALGGKVYHYRDKSGLECDAVIVLRDGRWGAVEVKLGAHEYEKAARNLISFAQKIDTDKMNNPSFLMILTGAELGYRREDGVYVVPIGSLRD